MIETIPLPGLERCLVAVLELTTLAAVLYLAGQVGFQLFLVATAPLEIRRQRALGIERALPLLAELDRLPPVTVLIPAFNEHRVIARTVRSVLASDYPRFEVVVVNDGSTDPTLGVLWRELDLVPSNDRWADRVQAQIHRAVFVSRQDPRLRVVDKRNSGKADALNTGINWSRHELICAVDADVVLDRQALARLAAPYVDDPELLATSGMIRLLNGCRSSAGGVVEPRLPSTFLERIQHVEYVRSFSVARLAFNRLRAHLIVSGAFGLFRRDALVAVGGYQAQAIGEDMELVVRLGRVARDQRHPGRIHFVADALCYTEAPTSLGELGRQRTRWHQGLLTSLRLHRGMLFRPRYRALGWLAFPYFLALELLSPVVELGGWLWLAALLGGAPAAPSSAPVLMGPIALTTLLLVLPVSLSVAGLWLDRLFWPALQPCSSVWPLLRAAVGEHLGYRQLLLLYRLRAFWVYYRSIHMRGGWRPPRRGGASIL